MNRTVTAVAKVGDATDATLAAVRATPRRARTALAVRRYRRAGIIAAVLTLALYLLAIGDIAVGGRSAAARVELAPDWTQRLWQLRAPYLFEPVLALHPVPQLTIFVSPGNLVLGGLLAGLVGLNLTAATYAANQQTSCGSSGYGRLLAALPAFLTGAACCVPTFLIVLGSRAAAVLLPVLAPMRLLLYPLSLVLLTAALVWGTRRLEIVRR